MIHVWLSFALLGFVPTQADEEGPKEQNAPKIAAISPTAAMSSSETVSSTNREAMSYEGSFPGSYLIPGTDLSLKIGGRIKLDAIHDFGAIGQTDKFTTSSIPVPKASSDGNTRFHARDTRLHLEARSPSEWGEVRAYVEGNFFGTGDSFTLRHAYVQTDHLLAGQTWTNFMMIESRPETLDFEGPDGSVFLRQAQARWTQPACDTAEWSIALEDPSSDVSGPVNSNPEQVFPDLTSGVRFENGTDGHTYVSAILREVAYNGAGKDSAIGYGASVSGRVNTTGKDNFRYQVALGQGIARYIEDLRGSGLDGALDSGGGLHALPTFGGFVSYQHHWNEKLRSTAVYSHTGVDNSSGQADSALKQTSYLSANLMVKAAKKLDVGVELLRGSRENKDGDSASVTRLQFSVIYGF